jgi:hypothetical protein
MLKYINFTTHTPAKQQQAVTSRNVIGVFVPTLSGKINILAVHTFKQSFL